MIKYVLRSMILAILGMSLAAAWANGTEFYVSPSGNDGHAGSKQAPFRTIERAKEEVRRKVKDGLVDPVTVYLQTGTYELTRNLIFGPEDSGTDTLSVTYAANPGDKVVLSGGRRITNWKIDESGTWIADLPDVTAGNWFFRQLVVDGQRAVRARWPNEEGVLRIRDVSNGVKSFGFNQPLPETTLTGQDTELVVYQNWSVTRGLIEASGEKQVTTATSLGWIGHGALTTASNGKPAFLEHARAFLDQPGEWFLDRIAGSLYYLPKAGEDPGTTEVVAPVLQRMVSIIGTRSDPVKNLHFEGIRFEHIDFTFPSIGFNEIQAAHFGTTINEPTYVHPVAIECIYARDCRFELCWFSHLNCSGIGFGPGCRNNAVVGCVIEDIGGNGVMVGWRGEGKLKDGMHETLDADWYHPDDVPAGNRVTDCLIRRCGMDAMGGVGVFVAFSADTLIARNEIYDLPYTGISIGYRWTTETTSQVRCIVEYNHIYDVTQKLADGGGIYTLGLQTGTVLRGNHIHDVKRSSFAHGGAPNNGFFIDEGSKGFLFEENVVYATLEGELRFNKNQPDWHVWKGNFFGDQEARAPAARAIIEKAGIGSEYRKNMNALMKPKTKPDFQRRRLHRKL